MGAPANHLPSLRIGVPLAILTAAQYFHTPKNDVPWPYSPLLGIVGAIVFVRLARWEGVSADLWSGLSVAAYFLPALTVGTVWGLGGLLVVGVAFVAKVMNRPPDDGRLVR